MRLEPDEPAAGPWRVVGLDELVQMLHEAAGTHPGRPRILAIDGRGGAGKSSLVRRLTARVPSSACVHTDDIAWHHAFFDWAGLLAENVLEPLRRGEPVDYRPVAWQVRKRPGSIVVPAGLDNVWIEGTGVVRSQLLPLLDATVWVQVDADDAQQRLLARDGDSPEQLRHVAEWDREERPFLRGQRPWATATLVLAGSQVLPHDPETHAVVARPVAGPVASAAAAPTPPT